MLAVFPKSVHARLRDVDDLARDLRVSLEVEGRGGEIAQDCRWTAETGYMFEQEVRRLARLYEEIVEKQRESERRSAETIRG